MADHALKIHEQPFNDILSGVKNCEVRNNDRGFQPGDTVQLHEIADTFTGRVMERKITHIQTGYGLPDGLCVLSYAQQPSQGGEAVALSVWYGPMPESNGKSNYTALLYRKGESLYDGAVITLDRSEYPDRVRYEADRVRYLIGELDAEPFILDYDPDKHSGYTHPADQVADDLTMVKVSRELLVKLLDEGRRAETWAAQDELRALLAKSEGVKP
jgi:hypothetical protein